MSDQQSSILTCPFCHEEDFDDVGLKHHLTHGLCDEYKKVERHPSYLHLSEPERRPVAAEPVAWMGESPGGSLLISRHIGDSHEWKERGWTVTPLFASPPQPANAEVREAAQKVLDECEVRDSLGVEGSNFMHCLICHGQVGPGVLGGKLHEDGCPIKKLGDALEDQSFSVTPGAEAAAREITHYAVEHAVEWAALSSDAGVGHEIRIAEIIDRHLKHQPTKAGWVDAYRESMKQHESAEGSSIRFLKEYLKTLRHTEAVADCAHCQLNYLIAQFIDKARILSAVAAAPVAPEGEKP